MSESEFMDEYFNVFKEKFVPEEKTVFTERAIDLTMQCDELKKQVEDLKEKYRQAEAQRVRLNIKLETYQEILSDILEKLFQ